MAELSGNYPTMLDMIRSQNPDGTLATVAPVLMQKNPILQHVQYKQANDGSGEITTVEASLPQAYLRTYNEVVPDGKGTNVQVRDTMAMLEQWSRADEKLARASGDVAGYRARELRKHISAMSNEAGRLAFYGNALVSPKECTGLAIRFSDTAAVNGRNLIDAAGTGGDNTSIWFIKHGEDGLLGITPRGSSAGLTTSDFGMVAAESHAGQTGNIAVFKERLSWDLGFSVKDWRNIARIAGIDVVALRAGVDDADLIDLMIDAYHSLESTEGVKIYANRTIMAILDKQRRDAVAAGGQLGYVEVDGKNVPAFRQLPMYVCEAILNTEAGV
ncbi:MAG TPA: hypothetical protein VFH61_04815 [Thermoleophilia bacterium]|nr:hypothetical protein [Thermoleophilia bacterium]